MATVEHPKYTPSRRYQVEWRITAPPGLIIEAHCVLGDIEISGFEKRAQVETELGDITARDLRNGIRARTSLGDVIVEGGGAIEAVTDLGTVHLYVMSGPSGPVTALSDLGNIHVRLPADRQGRLVADTDLGSLHLRLEGITMRMLRQRGHHFDAELSGMSEPSMTLGTDLGDVVITTYPAEQATVTANTK